MDVHRKLLLPCTCVGCCAVLGVDDYGDRDKYPDEENAWTFEFYSRRHSGTFGWRLKQAFALLFGRDYYVDCVSLDGHGLRQLREFIDENKTLRPANTYTTWTAAS